MPLSMKDAFLNINNILFFLCRCSFYKIWHGNKCAKTHVFGGIESETKNQADEKKKQKKRTYFLSSFA